MNINKSTAPSAQKNGMIAYLRQEEEAMNSAAQNNPAAETEDDLLTEGYLPEIYFQLKSDNPSDW